LNQSKQALGYQLRHHATLIPADRSTGSKRPMLATKYAPST
jgi:hypothetical protein